jgi:hypothetical protein
LGPQHQKQAQEFYVFPPDFPSPPPTGGFHTTFPHDGPPHSHPSAATAQTTPSAATFGVAYVAAQQNASRLKPVEVPLPISLGPIDSMPDPVPPLFLEGRRRITSLGPMPDPVLSALAAVPHRVEELQRRHILSRLRDQEETLRKWAMKLYTSLPETRLSVSSVPSALKLMLPCETWEIDFNDPNEWSVRLGFLVLMHNEYGEEMKDALNLIVDYLFRSDFDRYYHLQRSFTFLHPQGPNLYPFSSPLYFLSPVSLAHVTVNRTSKSYEVSSWIDRCITKINAAISTANDSLVKAGSAITTAYNLFTSLSSLSVDSIDTSLEERYISELIIHITSLDLKSAWSNVSETWSKFMNNIGRMMSGIKIPGHDGLLGNYPIHTL